MNNEKMRRDFDLWHLNSFTKHVLAKETQAAMLWMASKDIIWLGWKASRAELVIELPKTTQAGGPDDEIYWPAEVCAAIEAAGVRVKP